MGPENYIEGVTFEFFLGDPDFAAEVGLGFEDADFYDAGGGAELLGDGAFDIGTEGGVRGSFTDRHFAENANEAVLFRGRRVLIGTADEIEIAVEGVGSGFERSALAGRVEE